MMPWELVAWHVNPNASGGFDFGIDDPSFGPITQMIQYMNNKVRQVIWFAISHCLGMHFNASHYLLLSHLSLSLPLSMTLCHHSCALL